MVFLSPVRNERCTPASVAPNARCLEGLLLVFDSGYSGVSVLVADDHLRGPRTILNDFLQIFFALAGLNLPLCAKFLSYYAYVFFGNCSVVLKFNSNISALDLSMWTFFLVLKSDEFQLLFQMMHDFRVLHSHLYVFFAEDGSCLGSDGL
jgi:hypothetical protein